MSMDLSFLLFLRPMPRAVTRPENPKPEGGELERAGEIDDESEERSSDEGAPAEPREEHDDDDRVDTRLQRER